MTTVHRFERAEAKGIKLNFIEYYVNCNADSKKVVLQTCVTSMCTLAIASAPELLLTVMADTVVRMFF